jgi:acetoin utilization deacetylase AcuC-like enzyme
MLLHYSDDYVAAAHAFDTTRKARWVADAVRDDPRVKLVAPRVDSHVEEAIARIHAPAYVHALATGEPADLAGSQGFTWDPGLWLAIRASTAGVLAAVDAALGGDRVSGSLSSGMHHAGFASGKGFCSVNGLVVAADHAQRTHGVRVTILDVDAHAGGGTDELLRHHALDDVRHLDLTVSPFDSYVDRIPRPGDVNIEDPSLDDTAYLAAITRLLDLLPVGPDHLVLHNGGMDPYPAISFAALAARERMVAETLAERGTPAVFVLAGGYTWSASQDEVAASHAETVRAFATTVDGSLSR